MPGGVAGVPPTTEAPYADVLRHFKHNDFYDYFGYASWRNQLTDGFQIFVKIKSPLPIKTEFFVTYSLLKLNKLTFWAK
jgi:hypothetical protein